MASCLKFVFHACRFFVSYALSHCESARRLKKKKHCERGRLPRGAPHDFPTIGPKFPLFPLQFPPISLHFPVPSCTESSRRTSTWRRATNLHTGKKSNPPVHFFTRALFTNFPQNTEKGGFQNLLEHVTGLFSNLYPIQKLESQCKGPIRVTGFLGLTI